MVRDSLVRRGATALALWCLIFCFLATVVSTTALAQQKVLADFESPIIEHSTLEAGFVGGVEVFGATVVDNEEIEAVSLFYRFSGETEFAELRMREIASSSFYSVKVDTANVPLDTPAIEYYLQAQDASGNIVLKGFAFQPLIRTFKVAEPAVVAPVSEPVQAPVIEAKKINWLYVALGVIAVGGIATALGGDSGDSSSSAEGNCDGACSVTLTFGTPLP